MQNDQALPANEAQIPTHFGSDNIYYVKFKLAVG